MRLAIMQPYLFPYIGYFQLMNAVDRFVVYDDVTYIKQGWINRNRIMVNGEPHMFTMPLRNAGSNILIHEIEVGGPEYLKWRSKFLRTLDQAYKKAPFRSEVIALVEQVITPEEMPLTGLLLKGLSKVNERAAIETTIVPTSAGYENEQLKGAARVLDICKREGAEQYINPVGGRELYSKESFANDGIVLSFLRSRSIDFAPIGQVQLQGLSIIDVMMWNSTEMIAGYLRQYDLE